MFKKSKDKVRTLTAVPNPGEKNNAEASASTPSSEPSPAAAPAAPAPAKPGPALAAVPAEGAENVQLDELSEVCRVAWCEAFYRLAEGFSFKEDFVKEHLAPFMQQAGVDPEKLDADERAKALITFSSYIVCRGLAAPLEAIGLNKESPTVYSQAVYQTAVTAVQQAFVSIVDEWGFRTPMLPFVNVFSQAVYKQELDDIATAYLFGPAYEITLRRALFFNKWILLPENPEAEAATESADDEEPGTEE